MTSGDRDAVASELAALLAAAGLHEPWSDLADATTRMVHAGVDDLYAVSRTRLHARIVDDDRRAHPASDDASRRLVVTAGPPGAGKSTAIEADRSLDGFRHVDADRCKDALLEHELTTGSLDRWTTVDLGDGRPVSPREVSAYVHAESTTIADLARRVAMQHGEDVIVHGTLTSTAPIDAVLADMEEHGYRDLTVLVVATDLDVALERARSRWWTARTAGDDPLGARFVAPEAIRAAFDALGGSACARNAEELADRAAALGWSVTLTRV